MDLSKWIILGLCIGLISAQQPEPESTAEPENEPEPTPEHEPEPTPENEPSTEPEPEDPPYFGTTLGNFTQVTHGVSGMVHIISERQLMLTEFSYDGRGPDAFFYIGTSGSSPSANGMKIPNEMGSMAVLGEYSNAKIILKLPGGIEMQNIKWFSVWCLGVEESFGHVMFPQGVAIPKPVQIGEFSGAHGLSSGAVTILDHKRIRIEHLHYDGAGPDAYFYVGMGSMPTPGNTIIPDEKGSTDVLEAYTGQTIVLMLPAGLTVFNIKWLSVWCDDFNENFGHVTIPNNILVPVYTGEDRGFLGTWAGEINTQAHEVSGTVYIVDEMRIRLVDFNYDGAGPDAYFYMGFMGDNSGATPSAAGTRIKNERGRGDVLMSYNMADIVLTLPEGKTVRDIVWFSVWCDQFAVDFGHLLFPDDLGRIPEVSVVEDGFVTLAHDVASGAVTFLDERRVHIRDLHYDGTGPDAYFWVGRGTPDTSGWQIPNEHGSDDILSGYDGESITLTLPMGYTWYDVDYLSMWCRSVSQNFGHVLIPMDMLLPPYVEMEETLEHCQQFHDHFLVNWEIVDDYIHYEFVGALEGDDGYMAFGRSGSDSESRMRDADVFVAYWRNGEAHVEDYSLTSLAQCDIATGRGACPDTYVNSGTNDVEILKFRQQDGITFVTFRRMLSTGDSADRDTPSDGDMYIVWALGVLGNDGRVTKHNIRLTDYNTKLEMGMQCANIVPRETEELEAWDPEMIDDETEFVAQIGPAGGDRGYKAITKSQSWGIAWWINGKLIPEIVMERHVTYKFKVEGGNDLENSAEYHPFYITSDEEGGYAQKSPEEQDREHVLAGVNSQGEPTAVGRLCEWKPINGRDEANKFETFESYKQSLFLDCDPSGESAMLTFTPDDDTPDTIYYQCYTHKYLGWKITVIDEIIPTVGSATATTPIFATISAIALVTALLSKLLT